MLNVIKKKSVLVTFLLVFGIFLIGRVFASAKDAETSGSSSNGSGKIAPPAIRSVAWPAYQGMRTEPIVIVRSTAQVLRFDRAIARTAISNPNICDMTTIGGQDILLNAKEAGLANLIVWDSAGNIASYELESTLDLEKVQEMFQDIDPSADLNIVPFNNTVAVYGTTETSLKKKQIEEAAKAFDKSAVTFTRLKDSKQILLEVRFAEINRKNSKDFKLDVEALGRHFAARSLTGKTGSAAASTSSATNISRFAPAGSPITFQPLNLPSEDHANAFGGYFNDSMLADGFLKWLEEQNVLKIIARPNLVVKDGEEGNFLVGGEFPVPLSTQDRITIEYKEFGTKLKFMPEVLEGSQIKLQVETEVSELDFSNTVSFGGIVVPSIIKRAHKTVAELKDNQSLVIAGLLTQKINKVKRRVPFFSYIPVIGRTLFQSDEFSRTDVELLVVITPHLVKPFDLGEQKVLYDPKNVANAVRAYEPPYPDEQGDAINQMITQNEAFRKFHERVRKYENERTKKVMAPAPPPVLQSEPAVIQQKAPNPQSAQP